MDITKIETNQKRKLFLYKTTNIKYKSITKNLEQSIIKIVPDFSFQTLIGFGGGITESSGYALSTVNKDIYDNILDEYFSINDGLNYNICRLPIGSCDFSLKSYSYSYKEDLSDFSIKRDLQYIIPVIKSAQQKNPNIKFISSPWSPPAFMKTNKSLINGGKLLSQYRKLWTNYLIKYIQTYKKYDININYMTIQNEPNAKQLWESCNYTPSEEADLLKNFLFPLFKSENLNTKFLIWDHNKDSILKRSLDVFVKHNAFDFADGIAFHWYTGNHFESLNTIHHLFPNKILLHTEGCTGYSHFNSVDELSNAEMYANEIIGDLNNNVHGFIDWNIVLEYNRWTKSCKKLL